MGLGQSRGTPILNLHVGEKDSGTKESLFFFFLDFAQCMSSLPSPETAYAAHLFPSASGLSVSSRDSGQQSHPAPPRDTLAHTQRFPTRERQRGSSSRSLFGSELRLLITVHETIYLTEAFHP